MNLVRNCTMHQMGAECDGRLARERQRNKFAERACFEWHEVDKVYALSDIHGDARLLLLCLLRIGVISDAISLEWKGEQSVVVICGDLIDDCRRNCANSRGRDAPLERRMELGDTDGANEWEVLALLNVLVAKGARIVWVMGNHELMRMQEASAGSSHRAYQRHVTRDYERRRHGPRAAVWSKGGDMAQLFGPLRCVVTVGNVLFIHADPVDVRGSMHFEPREGAYATAREYAEHVNETVAKHREDAFTGEKKGSINLVWGRRLGHAYAAEKCHKIMPSQIKQRTFVVRGHCITGSARNAARGVTIHPALRNPATNVTHFVDSNRTGGAKPCITFGCLEFADGPIEGIVSGVARVDCGASASIGANTHMGVLEIRHLGNGAVSLSQIRFAADWRRD
jgi:hypothetical protein